MTGMTCSLCLLNTIKQGITVTINTYIYDPLQMSTIFTFLPDLFPASAIMMGKSSLFVFFPASQSAYVTINTILFLYPVQQPESDPQKNPVQS